MSNLYRVQLILGKAKEQDMHAECAILYGKVRYVSLQSVNRTPGHQIYDGPGVIVPWFQIMAHHFPRQWAQRTHPFLVVKKSLFKKKYSS